MVETVREGDEDDGEEEESEEEITSLQPGRRRRRIEETEEEELVTNVQEETGYCSRFCDNCHCQESGQVVIGGEVASD